MIPANVLLYHMARTSKDELRRPSAWSMISYSTRKRVLPQTRDFCADAVHAQWLQFRGLLVAAAFQNMPTAHSGPGDVPCGPHADVGRRFRAVEIYREVASRDRLLVLYITVHHIDRTNTW